MSGYTEVLYVIFAMTIVSTMALNANRFIQVNNYSMVEGQLEEQVIAYSQNIIEESRALAFDEATTYDATGNSTVPVYIPNGFSSLGTDGEAGRTQFDDFDDFNGFSETVSIAGVKYDVNVVVEYVVTSDFETYTKSFNKSTLKRITVNMESDFLRKNQNSDNTNYNFSFIRSYYAD
ncbi:MAG: hypothetical protein CL670_08915 [Balneola sp.]|nr:hypothetical protein [Balneola sp.]MBE79259.1 hypothetical protein [Balneola sp.]|tara:strand:- start:900 stop:1430 length:531 start_codon:yes stop_codon:yes gene_type:complete